MDIFEQLTRNEVLAGDPFFNVIVKDLSWVDLYNLSNSCTFYKEFFNKQKLHEHAIMSVNSMFYDLFGEYTEKFKNLIKTTNSVVTGLVIRDALRKDYIDDKYIITIYTSLENTNIFDSNRIKKLLNLLNNNHVELKILYVPVFMLKKVQKIYKYLCVDIYKNIYYYEGNKEIVRLNSDILTNQTYYDYSNDYDYNNKFDKDNAEKQFKRLCPLYSREINVIGPLHSTNDHDFYYSVESDGSISYRTVLNDYHPPKLHNPYNEDESSESESSEDEDIKELKEYNEKLLIRLRTQNINNLKCIYGEHCPDVENYNRITMQCDIPQANWHIHLENAILHFRNKNVILDNENDSYMFVCMTLIVGIIAYFLFWSICIYGGCIVLKYIVL